MMPIGDHNPIRRIERPFVTYGIMIACVVIFLLQMAGGNYILISQFAVLPGQLTGIEVRINPDFGIPWFIRVLSYQFLHGDIWHLVGNMFALWVVGNNVEDAMGHRKFVAFYLFGGVVAAVVQSLIGGAPNVPLIGASGSISALFGAYLLLHPMARIIFLFFFIPVTMPAFVFFGIWFAQQVLGVVGGPDSNIAWWAHLGGFAVGLLLIPFIKDPSQPLDPFFAWADIVHRTPVQKRWRSHRRQQSQQVRQQVNLEAHRFEQRPRERDPVKEEFKRDYRRYLDSIITKQELDAKWGEGAARTGQAQLGRPSDVQPRPSVGSNGSDQVSDFGASNQADQALAVKPTPEMSETPKLSETPELSETPGPKPKLKTGRRSHLPSTKRD